MNFTQSIQEKEIRDIFCYWLDRRAPGGVPERNSIDPRTIPHRYLPNLFMYQREINQRFRCKLIGTDLVRVLGRDETGMYLDEILDPPIAGEQQELFAKAVETGRPVYYRYLAVAARGQKRLFSRILLPIASRPGQPDQVFGMVLYGPAENRPAEGRRAGNENRLVQVVVAGEEDLAGQVSEIAGK